MGDTEHAYAVIVFSHSRAAKPIKVKQSSPEATMCITSALAGERMHGSGPRWGRMFNVSGLAAALKEKYYSHTNVSGSAELLGYLLPWRRGDLYSSPLDPGARLNGE